MKRFLDAWLRNRTEANAARLRAYIAAHPFCLCALPLSQMEVLKEHGFA